MPCQNAIVLELCLVFRARLTLPHSLSAIDGEDGSVVVVAKEKIPAKTKFGPFEARKTTADIVIDNGFVLKVKICAINLILTTV